MTSSTDLTTLAQNLVASGFELVAVVAIVGAGILLITLLEALKR